MARIPYFDETAHPELADQVATIKAGRRGELLNVYKLLLHSPALTESWKRMVDNLRDETVLDARTREIAILRCAYVNNSAYEINQHVPRHSVAAGLIEAEWKAVAAWPDSQLLSARDAAVVAYADQISRSPQVSDDVYQAAAAYLTTRELVELTLLISFYCMHARFIGAFEIDLEKPKST